ncbi:MAG: ATP-binding protein, partial [Actinobacteria bacterium HGW-Actinobacteria-7]
YNEAVREAQIDLLPCAYLHNYKCAEPPAYDPLLDPAYLEYLERAPAFCNGDVVKLRDFICRHIQHGDDGQVLYHIESGRLRPSKSLQDALTGMLAGNDEFVMIDDQKVIFEQAVHLAREAQRTGERHVLIVRGGPGTGKSVVAVNLLVRLTAEEMVVQYVSKNSAPRNVYAKLLQQGNRSKAYIANLFRGPGKFFEHTGAPLDVVVVDEAHRLNEKSGLFQNLGENQIKEIVAASRFSVFFIDETQRVTIKDIGSVSDIRAFAEQAGAHVHEADLFSQFRCNGSDSYLDWLDDALSIRPAEERITDLDYDFRVFDDPHQLFAAIAEKNAAANKARVVAGYCWEWPKDSKPNPNTHDIVLGEHGFSISWNLATTGTWAIDDSSIHQVGCVHTCQGLEFDYVGVIIGDDMRVEGGEIITDHTKRAKSDKSLSGIKSLAKADPTRANRIADEIIRNTYRVLMTRGLRGCYVFCTDPALAAYLRERMPRPSAPAPYAPMPEQLSLAAEDPLED